MTVNPRFTHSSRAIETRGAELLGEEVNALGNNPDTHGRHDLLPDLPDGDIFIHAGDSMNSGLYLEEIVSFNRWLAKQPILRRVVCSGNHDRLFQNAPDFARPLLTNAAYLENTGVTIDGASFGVHLMRRNS